MHLPSNQHFVDHKHSVNQFEQWLRKVKTEKEARHSNLRIAEEVYIIPVVVHVIHSGQALGQGVNIPTDQILSQIEVLNEDYRKLNADTAQTFEPFKAVAADTKIEFRLAVQDPEGLPTTGIVRTQGVQSSYSISQAATLADISSWPPESYLNIWVTDLTSGLLGYAQFPVSNEPGLDTDRNPNPAIDGVVIDYEYFGVGFNADDFSRGRTATHEIGHYLGLRHIWGDGGCSRDDFCDDTPLNDSSTSGCPSEPSTSCGSIDMNQNFLDYTDDACMSLFTSCQAERMRLVLENSPRRKSLLISKGLEPVQLEENDLGIRNILGLFDESCSGSLSPAIEVRNYGTNTIDQFVVQLFVNGELAGNRLQSALNLTPGSTRAVNFDELVLPEDATYDLRFEITSVNGTTDGKAGNNIKEESIYVSTLATGEIVSNFESPSAWNYSESSEIQIRQAPKSTVENQATVFNFFGSEQSLGTYNILESPTIRLNPLSIPRLEFSYAYNHPEGNHAEALFVIVSTDCGATYPAEQTVFSGYGSGLNTVSDDQDNTPYVPSGSQDWRNESVSLSRFIDEEYIKIAFIGQNGHGNNLYLDDITVIAGPNPDFDLALRSVGDFPIASCTDMVEGSIEVINNGNQDIDGFSIDYFIDDQYAGTSDFSNLAIESQSRSFVSIAIEGLTLQQSNKVTFISQIAGAIDEFVKNDTLSQSVWVGDQTVQLPYRALPTANDWNTYSMVEANGWQNNDEAFFIDLQSSAGPGELFYLISPIIETSELQELSLGYESAYAYRENTQDELLILADINCNGEFNYELARFSGQNLSTADYENNWQPESAEDWSSGFVDLSFLLNLTQEVRLAFVARNRGGSTIWLRNVELFENNEPSIPIEENYRVYPNPANDEIKIRFNLETEQNLNLQLISMQGKVIFDQTFPGILNQTYSLITAHENNGLYLLKITGENFQVVERVIIWH